MISSGEVGQLLLNRRVLGEGDDRHPPESDGLVILWLGPDHLLAQPPQVRRHRQTSPPLVVDPQHDHSQHCRRRREDHHRGVVDAEDGRVVRGGDPRGHRHQEHLKKDLNVPVIRGAATYRHVEHGGDAQRDLLS